MFTRSLLAVLCVMLMMTSSVLAQVANPLSGTWEHRDAQGNVKLTLTFSDDGSGMMDGEAISWARDGNKLNLNIGGEKLSYNFTLEGDSLTISGGDLPAPTVFKKKAGRGLGGRGVGGGDGGNAGGGMNPPPFPPADNRGGGAPANNAVPPEIVGIWSDGQDQFDIRADGTCLFQGMQLTFTAGNGVITLKGPGGTADITYKMDGPDKMITSFQGETSTLTRVKPGQNNGGGNAGGGMNPPPFPPQDPRGGNNQPPFPPQDPRGGNNQPPFPPQDPRGGGAQQGADFMGSWVDDKNNTFEFRPDGTHTAFGQTYKYKAQGNIISLEAGQNIIMIQYTMQGPNKMQLLVNGQTMNLTRAGNAGGGGFNGGGQGPNQNQPAYIGTWRNQFETFELRPDGQCNYNGTMVPYTVQGNNLTLTGPQGAFTFQFQIQGDTLTLIMNGQPVPPYTRVR